MKQIHSTKTPQRRPEKMQLKDKIDIFFRLIGLFAIAIPIYLVFLQQKATLRSQKALQQFEVYSTTATELYSLMTRPVNSAEFIKSSDKLSFELYPKVAYLFEDSILKQMGTLKENIKTYSTLRSNQFIIDSLIDHGSNLSGYLYSYRSNGHGPVDRPLDSELTKIDSFSFELHNYKNELQVKKLGNSLSDTNDIIFIKRIAALNDNAGPFFVNFIRTCNGTFDVLQSKRKFRVSDQVLFDSLNSKKIRLIAVSKNILPSYHQIADDYQHYLTTQITSLELAMRKSNRLLEN